MQTHKIFINPRFSGTSVAISSDLQVNNGYLSHTQDALGDGVVNEFNVRAFLNDEKNNIIINEFYIYLNANTTDSQYREVFYSDKKLADIFKEFYETTVTLGVQTSTSVINQNLTGTTSLSVLDHNFNYLTADGIPAQFSGSPQSLMGSNRLNKLVDNIVTTTEEDSYYVDVYLRRSSPQISLQVSNGDIENVLIKNNEFSQGFVDLNNLSEENDVWSDVPLSVRQCFVFSDELEFVDERIFDSWENPGDDVTAWNDFVDLANSAYASFVANGCTMKDVYQPSEPIYKKRNPDGSFMNFGTYKSDLPQEGLIIEENFFNI